jgi:hypothetical protein
MVAGWVSMLIKTQTKKTENASGPLIRMIISLLLGAISAFLMM